MAIGLCSKCGAWRKVHVHHVDGDHSNIDDDNLKVLCISCHRLTHGPAPRGTGNVKLVEQGIKAVGSRAGLAAALGVSSQSIYRWQRGEVIRDPTKKLLRLVLEEAVRRG